MITTGCVLQEANIQVDKRGGRQESIITYKYDVGQQTKKNKEWLFYVFFILSCITTTNQSTPNPTILVK